MTQFDLFSSVVALTRAHAADLGFRQGAEQMQVWKHRELMRAQVEIVQAGLRVLDGGADYFGPDDLAPDITFDGQGLVGSAIHALRSAHVIADYWGSHPDDGVHHGRRRSKRESANGRKVSLYQITSRSAAIEFLARHGHVTVDRQRRLAL